MLSHLEVRLHRTVTFPLASPQQKVHCPGFLARPDKARCCGIPVASRAAVQEKYTHQPQLRDLLTKLTLSTPKESPHAFCIKSIFSAQK